MKYFTFILFTLVYFVISPEIFSWTHELSAKGLHHFQAFGHFPVTFLLLVSGHIPCVAPILSALRKLVPQPGMWSIWVPRSRGHSQSTAQLPGICLTYRWEGTGNATSTPCQEANTTLLTGVYVYTQWHLALNDTARHHVRCQAHPTLTLCAGHR